MKGMFERCWKLTDLDMQSWDTGKVTDMSEMFMGCTEITSLNVINFNTSKVTDMSDMFADCEYLEGLDLIGFDTKNVETFKEFLFESENLEWIRIGDDFDLFERSAQNNKVVTIQDWYDLEGNLVSDNYMVGFDGGAGTYVTSPTDGYVFAV